VPTRKRAIAAAGTLILAVLACFQGVVHNGFLSLDDPVYVLDNPAARAGLTWEGLGQTFTTVPLSYWQPLAFLSHMIDVQLFGVNAGAHHLASVGWHAVNTALVFVVLLRLTGAFYRSLLVAALFGFHPMHVEPAAWIASRKDLLSGFFFLIGLLAYSRYNEHRTFPRYLCVCIAFALGLMAKPNIIAFPLILLLLDFWPLRRKMKDAVIEKVPLLLLSGVSLLITLSTIAPSGQLATDLHPHVTGTPQILKAALIAALYLPKFFWPYPVSIFYITDHLASGLAAAVVAMVIVIGVSGLVIRYRERVPYILVGWFWFLLAVLPSTGVMVADRFSYLPFVGMSIAAVWGITELAGPRRVPRIAASVAAAAVLTLFGALSIRQVSMWRTSQSIFEQALANDPDNYVVRQWLGDTLGTQGRFREAIDQYERALAVHPDYFLVELNCARAYLQAGSEDDALRHLAAAARLRPELPDTYKQMGDIQLAQGNLLGARGSYTEARRRHYPDIRKIDGLLQSLESALSR
jgi:protein O-mannosyl-transferase